MGRDIKHRNTGFTVAVGKLIGCPEPSGNRIARVQFTGTQLLEIVKLLPPWNLKDAQNAGPQISAFTDIARVCPRIVFGGYIVGKERCDERLSIDSVIFPEDITPAMAEMLATHGYGEPDENGEGNVPDLFAGTGDPGEKWRRWWWD